MHSVKTILGLIFVPLIIISCSTHDFKVNPNSTEYLSFIDSIRISNPDSAFALANIVALTATENDDQLKLAKANLLMGIIAQSQGRFDLSLGSLLRAQQIYRDMDIKPSIAETSGYIGDFYQSNEQWTLANENYKIALNIYLEISDTLGIAETYGKIGHLFEKEHLYDSALLYQSSALDLYKHANNPVGLAFIYDNIGSIYEDLLKFDQALSYFNQAYEINKSQNNLSGLIININNIGDIYRKSEQFDKAHQYSTLALRKAKELKSDYQLNSAYRDLAKLHQAQNNGQLAYQYLDSAYDLNREIFNMEIAHEIAQTSSFYELGKKEQQIQILQKEHQIDEIIKTSISAVSILLILIGFLVIYNFRQRFAKSKRLLEAEREITKVNLLNTQLKQERLENEIKSKQIIEEKLKREIELQSNSMAKSALHIIQKNEFLTELKGKLKSIRKADGEDIPKKIKKLTNSIDFSFNLDDDWQEFETIFQQLHHDFFDQLKLQHPDLTASEVRLCAMIRLNLNSNDMSSIMGISQDSLRIARYRLRKKLGLDKGSNLYSHVINIG